MADATTNIEEENKTKDENESRKGDGSKQVGENGDPTAEEPSLKFESQNPQVDTQKVRKRNFICFERSPPLQAFS